MKSRNALGFGSVRFVVVSAGCGDYSVVNTANGATVAVVEGYQAACDKADELEKAAK